jgi:hypothetical protein
LNTSTLILNLVTGEIFVVVLVGFKSNFLLVSRYVGLNRLVLHPEEFIENLPDWVLGVDHGEQYKAYLRMKYSDYNNFQFLF